MFYETATNDHGLPRDPFKACVVPRPIGWISTLSADGVLNLAPFSYFNACGDNPPQVMYAPNGQHREGGPKDSLKNVLETGEFVANLATWQLREAVRQSSRHVERAVSEFDVADLETEPSHLVKAPRVKGTPVHLECKLIRTVSLLADDTEAPNDVVFGHVVGVNIDESVIVEGRVDVSKLRPIARLGYSQYAVVQEAFNMPFLD